jgi:hypothetical protein
MRTCLMLTVVSLVSACATPQNTVETYPGRELAPQLLARDASELKDQHGDQFNDLKIVGFDPSEGHVVAARRRDAANAASTFCAATA